MEIFTSSQVMEQQRGQLLPSLHSSEVLRQRQKNISWYRNHSMALVSFFSCSWGEMFPMVPRAILLAQVDGQMADGKWREGDFLMLPNPVYCKPFRRARQEGTRALLATYCEKNVDGEDAMAHTINRKRDALHMHVLSGYWFQERI